MTKNHVGRPPRYKKKEQIQDLFDEYSKECADNGKIITKAGLLVKLGIDRETYRRYKAKKKFSDTIKKIEGIIEDAWVQALHHGKQATGPIFYLKNAFKEDYKDRTETDLTTGGKPIPILGGLPIKKNVHQDNSNGQDNQTEKKN